MKQDKIVKMMFVAFVIIMICFLFFRKSGFGATTASSTLMILPENVSIDVDINGFDKNGNPLPEITVPVTTNQGGNLPITLTGYSNGVLTYNVNGGTAKNISLANVTQWKTPGVSSSNYSNNQTRCITSSSAANAGFTPSVAANDTCKAMGYSGTTPNGPTPVCTGGNIYTCQYPPSALIDFSIIIPWLLNMGINTTVNQSQFDMNGNLYAAKTGTYVTSALNIPTSTTIPGFSILPGGYTVVIVITVVSLKPSVTNCYYYNNWSSGLSTYNYPPASGSTFNLFPNWCLLPWTDTNIKAGAQVTPPNKTTFLPNKTTSPSIPLDPSNPLVSSLGTGLSGIEYMTLALGNSFISDNKTITIPSVSVTISTTTTAVVLK